MKRVGVFFLLSGAFAFVGSFLASISLLALMYANVVPFGPPPAWSFVSLVVAAWLGAIGGMILVAQTFIRRGNP